MTEEMRDKTDKTTKPLEERDRQTPVPNPAMSERHGETIEDLGQLQSNDVEERIFSHPQFKREAKATLLASAVAGYPAYWLLLKLNTLLSINITNLPTVGLVGGIGIVMILVVMRALSYGDNHD